MGLGIDDGLEQVGPIVEDDVGRYGSQVLEELVSGAACGPGVLPGDDAELCDGVKCEGQ